MQPQQNKDYVLNLKTVSTYALCKHLVHKETQRFLDSKTETFLWACCQDHLFELVSAAVRSYTIRQLF